MWKISSPGNLKCETPLRKVLKCASSVVLTLTSRMSKEILLSMPLEAFDDAVAEMVKYALQ